MPAPTTPPENADQPEAPGDLSDGRLIAIAAAFLGFLSAPCILEIVSGRELGSFGGVLTGFSVAVSVAVALCLMGIWIALGNGRFFVRLGSLGLLFAVLVCALGISIAAWFLVILTIASPLFILRGYGFQLKVREAGSTAPRLFQLTIRHLLAATAIASVGALLIRLFWQALSGELQMLAVSAAATLAFAAITFVTTCATLVPRTKGGVLKMLFSACVLAVVLSWGVLLMMLSAGRYHTYHLTQLFIELFAGSLCHVMLVSLALLAFRGVGYRLARHR